MEKVIVAVDGQPASDAAVDWIIARSKTRPIVVEVTTVVDPVASSAEPAVADQVRAAYEAVLRRAAERISELATTAGLRTLVRHGRPRAELVEATSVADLLVVGSEHQRPTETSVFSTLPVRLAATARCPLVVVPSGWHEPEPDLPVMVGVDALHPQPTVTSIAASEADDVGAEVIAVNAWSVPTLLAVVMFGHPSIWKSYGDTRREAFDRLRVSIAERNPTTRLRGLLREGPVSRVVTEEARGARLVVLGRHVHESAEDRLLGSTAHDVLLRMPCPVMVVPV